ncbi:hypothetical protein AB4Y89_11385 [Terriglobus sp. 2YAB30_2]|uniref:hypothetical protein n=1 Tax=unclassified Terriglobus TaxID=2628988 RepID=UPI003F9E557D
MAAITIAQTSVVAFTNNHYKSNVRGAAFIKALPTIERTLGNHKRKNIIAVVGTNGAFRLCEESPLPSRKSCDARDWDSFERVCKEAGRLFLTPKH